MEKVEEAARLFSDEPYLVQGLKDQLDDNRSVFVGQVSGQSDVYIALENVEKEIKIKLSFETAKALCDLLARISERGLMSMANFVAVDIGDGGSLPDMDKSDE